MSTGRQHLVVLDTHVLIWLLEGVESLGRRAREMIDKALGEDRLAISAISFWEVAVLGQKGRLVLAQPIRVWRQRVLELGISEIPVTGDIGIAAAALPDFHADPADRMITATATSHRAILLSADDRILNWTGPLQRHDARL